MLWLAKMRTTILTSSTCHNILQELFYGPNVLDHGIKSDAWMTASHFSREAPENGHQFQRSRRVQTGRGLVQEEDAAAVQKFQSKR